MKVLYIVHSFPPFHWRGTEIYAMELARSMASYHQTFLFHLADDAAAEDVSLEHAEFEGIKVYRARVNPDPSEPETYFFHPGLEKSFQEVLQEVRPDLVHFIYFAGGLPLSLPLRVFEQGSCLYITVTDFSGICPRGQLIDREGRTCKGPRRALRCAWCLFGRTFVEGHSRIDRLLREIVPPSIVPVTSRPELQLLMRRLDAIKKAFTSADRVIFPNQNCRERYSKAGFRGNFTVMDYGIDTAPFAGHRKSESSEVRLGFVGQLLPHKGLHVLAEALPGLEGEWRLLIYGSLSDPGAEEYYNSIELPGPRTSFRGTFDFSDMNQVLEDIDVLVVPSTWEENCPLIVKYALATGTVAVTSDQPGIIAEPENKRGLVRFKSGDASDLCRALSRAVSLVKDAGSSSGESGVTDIRDQADYLAKGYEACVIQRNPRPVGRNG
ncbi:MAG: glycosyltransferase [bacterium]